MVGNTDIYLGLTSTWHQLSTLFMLTASSAIYLTQFAVKKNSAEKVVHHPFLSILIPHRAVNFENPESKVA